MLEIKKRRRAKIVEVFVSTAVSIVLGFLVGGLLLRISGYNAMGAYAVMFGKVINDFGLVVGKATPLIFTGLAIAIPYSIGLVNLGAEGQMLVGAFAAAMVGSYIHVPAFIHVPLVILAGALAGTMFSTFCGFLKLRFKANEVVTTVMLNSVVSLLAQYCVNGPLNGEPSQPQTKMIDETAYLSKFSVRDEYSTAIFIAIAVAIIIWVFMNKTVLGYEMRAVGLNMKASLYKGIRVEQISLLAMSLGGLIAGIGGSCEVMGLQHNYYQGFVQNYGYTGIGVALIARNNPLAVIPAAFFLAIIRVGGIAIGRQTPIPSYFIWVLQGVIIVTLAIPNIMEHLKQTAYAIIRFFEHLQNKGEKKCKNS